MLTIPCKKSDYTYDLSGTRAAALPYTSTEYGVLCMIDNNNILILEQERTTIGIKVVKSKLI